MIRESLLPLAALVTPEPRRGRRPHRPRGARPRHHGAGRRDAAPLRRRGRAGEGRAPRPATRRHRRARHARRVRTSPIRASTTTSTHGTGCTLSAAVTAGLALGRPARDGGGRCARLRAPRDRRAPRGSAPDTARSTTPSQLRHHPLDERARARPRPGRPTSITSRWSSFVRCHPGGRVGDRREAEAPEARRARGDHLDHRGHSHRVRAEPLQHPDLGRRLVARPQQPDVHPFGERQSCRSRATSRARARSAGSYGSDMSGNRFSPGSAGPNSAFRKRQVDLVGDQHDRARAEAPPDPAGGVGEHHGPTPSRAKTRTGSAVSDAGWPSYMWNRPLCTSTVRPCERARHQLAAVADHRRRGEVRDLARRESAPRPSAARRTGPGPSRARWRTSASGRRAGARTASRAASSTIAVAPAPARRGLPAVTAGCPRSWRRGSWRACRRAWRGGRAARGPACAPGPARRCRRAGCRPS